MIGTGRMGHRYIQVVTEKGLNLVEICDPNPEALAIAEKEQGVTHYTQIVLFRYTFSTQR